MANLFIILTIILWGLGAFLGKSVLKGAPPIYTYLLEAFGTLTIAFLTATIFRKELIAAFHNFNWSGYLFGICWGIGTVTFVLALKYKPANTAVPLTALYPLITVILAIIFLKETITLKICIGVILAVIAGILLI